MTVVQVAITLFVAVSIGAAVGIEARHDGVLITMVALETVSVAASLGAAIMLWFLLIAGAVESAAGRTI